MVKFNGDKFPIRMTVLPDDLMEKIGSGIAKMHMADIIHGDLTTSNMMLRPVDGNTAEFVSHAHLQLYQPFDHRW